MKNSNVNSVKESKISTKLLEKAIDNLNQVVGGKGSSSSSSVDFIVEEYGGL